MFFHGIVPAAATNPDLFGTTNLRSGMGFHELHLEAQFFLFPKVIRVQVGDERTSGPAEPQIPGRAHAPVVLIKILDPSAKSAHDFSCPIVRSVIDNQELPIFAGLFPLEIILGKNGLNGFFEKRGPVMGGNNCSDQEVFKTPTFSVVWKGIVKFPHTPSTMTSPEKTTGTGGCSSMS